ncbi:MAG TPA: S8 family serine peptidase [Candidatus Limnocylindria bacterium]|jgi:hypothetical protein|nr:S8 family serine peptidase [Candidatus Limnocylindria bacterium]
MGRLISCLLALLALTAPLHAADAVSLRWLAKSNRVDAALHEVPLPKVLAKIARATGWSIFLEPGTQRVVSATFTNLPPREALNRLLGSLSFVHVPQGKAGKLLIYRSSIDAATEEVEAGGDDEYTLEPGPIPNELIVRLKPGAKITPEELAKKLGAKLVGRIDGLNAYRLRFESAEAANAAREELKKREDVAGVENNVRLPGPTEPNQPSAATTAGFNLKPRLAGDKDNVVVALIDTLLQPQPMEYEQFIKERLSVVEGKFEVDNSQPMHATAMLQAMLDAVAQMDTTGQGSTVRVLPINVYDPNAAGEQPTTTTWNVMLGLQLAASRGATVFNLSLGGPNDSPMLDEMIASIHSQGGLVLAATGNTPGTEVTFPSGSPGALGVTAGDRNGGIASFANTGPQTQLIGPGTTFFSFQGRTWVAQGTSSATAWTSGLAAGAMSARSWTAVQAEPWLLSTVPYKPGKP